MGVSPETPPTRTPFPPPGWKAAIVGCQLPEGTPGGGTSQQTPYSLRGVVDGDVPLDEGADRGAVGREGRA